MFDNLVGQEIKSMKGLKNHSHAIKIITSNGTYIICNKSGIKYQYFIDSISGDDNLKGKIISVNCENTRNGAYYERNITIITDKGQLTVSFRAMSSLAKLILEHKVK